MFLGNFLSYYNRRLARFCGLILSVLVLTSCGGESGNTDPNSSTIVINTPSATNTQPAAISQSIVVNKNSSVSITLTGTDADNDALIYMISKQPTSNTLSGTPPNLIYTPKVDFLGSDSFTFTVNDGSETSNEATVSINVVLNEDAAKPFPQENDYSGLNKPTHKTQNELNQAVIIHFDEWKNTYLTQSNGNTPGGGYYIKMGGEGCSPNATTSEAHGYGMIIMALMAGQEPQAKHYFDGMYNMYDQHRSIINNHLMSWCINPTEDNFYNNDSATDGDMDIAYSLILAHEQWGSDGSINYLDEAKRIITKGIKVSNMGTDNLILLGDWVSGNSAYTYGTRPSDWMTSHLRVFATATGDTYWNETADNIYQIMNIIRNNYAQTTGLMPDFIDGENPRPAPENFLEATTDGQFSWNACRVPLRIAFDAAHFGNSSAREALTYIVDWIELKTLGKPSAIVAGYDLNGDALVNYSNMAFTAPMIAAAAVANGDHQNFINKGWDLINSSNNNTPNTYYPNSIKLLSMLFISGNWWQPLQ